MLKSIKNEVLPLEVSQNIFILKVFIGIKCSCVEGIILVRIRSKVNEIGVSLEME
jgi:hypothetical protein